MMYEDDELVTDELTEDDVRNGAPELEVESEPGPYLDIVLPRVFMLRDALGAVDGPYKWDDFSRDPASGAYAYQQGSRAVILRVTSAENSFRTLYSVDGGGRKWRYDVVRPEDVMGFRVDPVEVAPSALGIE